MLIQEESWIDVVAVPARWVPLDTDAERALAFDEARKEPARIRSASESFLLIVRLTRHVVTIVNARSDVTLSSAGYPDVPAYSRIFQPPFPSNNLGSYGYSYRRRLPGLGFKASPEG